MHTCCTQQNYFVAIRLEGVTSLRRVLCLEGSKWGREYLGYVNSGLHLHGSTFSFIDFVGHDIGANMRRTHCCISMAAVVI